MRALFVYMLIILLAVTTIQHCARTLVRPIRPANYRELQEL